jgi:hypothetical protein
MLPWTIPDQNHSKKINDRNPLANSQTFAMSLSSVMIDANILQIITSKAIPMHLIVDNAKSLSNLGI